MRKKIITLLCAATLSVSMLAACGNSANKETQSSQASQTGQSAQTEALSDEQAAQQVADLIDAIYVQKWTQETDAQCTAAKEAWDALTDEQKALVKGEYADPDYFGRDTGDASADDPLNGDDIGENEILVVSFGTSFNDSRAKDIGGIEKAIAAANPDWSVRRAFTAQIIINHVQARDGEKIDNMDQALERAVANGVKNLVIQPTHLMRGIEYEELMSSVEKYADKFETIKIAEPLLGEVGEDAKVINADKKAVAEAVVEAAAKEANSESIDKMADAGTALVLFGHGTSHTAKVSYNQMQTQLNKLGYKNVFIGTVEGEPEETACDKVIEAVSKAGYKKVILRPLMVVAGDHAYNDMAGDEADSWKSMFIASGKFDAVEAQLTGLGSIEAVQKIYVDHTAEAISNGKSISTSAANSQTASELEDGEYTAEFTTDSKMFHVNETMNNKGKLIVKDGKMTIHVTLAGKGIHNLFVGLAEDAQKAGAVILQPTEDQVKYDDGTTDTVYGFDIPVPVLDQEFDLALIGKKGKWYDHKVKVHVVK